LGELTIPDTVLRALLEQRSIDRAGGLQHVFGDAPSSRREPQVLTILPADPLTRCATHLRTEQEAAFWQPQPQAMAYAYPLRFDHLDDEAGLTIDR
jgi:hypothetical protein